MPAVHRNGDSRACGATTTVVGDTNVFCNGQLISVNGDPNTDGGGSLIAQCNNVFADGKLVVILGNDADPDSQCIPVGGAHCDPSATSGSPNVFTGA